MPFQFTGFADEAEKTLAGQISTLKEVGWSAIELRLIDGKNVCDQTPEEWNKRFQPLKGKGLKSLVLAGKSGTGPAR